MSMTIALPYFVQMTIFPSKSKQASVFHILCYLFSMQVFSNRQRAPVATGHRWRVEFGVYVFIRGECRWQLQARCRSGRFAHCTCTAWAHYVVAAVVSRVYLTATRLAYYLPFNANCFLFNAKRSPHRFHLFFRFLRTVKPIIAPTPRKYWKRIHHV